MTKQQTKNEQNQNKIFFYLFFFFLRKISKKILDGRISVEPLKVTLQATIWHKFYRNYIVTTKVILSWRWVKFLKKFAVFYNITTIEVKMHRRLVFTDRASCQKKATAKKWFARFRYGNFDVKDALRSGRLSLKKSMK